MWIKVNSPIVRFWLKEDAPLAQVKHIEGTVVRSKEGRVTKRVQIANESFYIKYHGGVGWSEIIKNLSLLRLPIVGARNEWLAIQQLEGIGVDTLTISAYGASGFNPAKKQSFLITEDLYDSVSLEDLFSKTMRNQVSVSLKRALIERVATMARRLHQSGMNHRDLYICHFLLNISNGIESVDINNFRLHLIDLHRALIRKKVPYRWLVKDLASLYFSILDLGFTKRDIFRFLTIYFELPLATVLSSQSKLLIDVRERAIKLYQRDNKCLPELPL